MQEKYETTQLLLALHHAFKMPISLLKYFTSINILFLVILCIVCLLIYLFIRQLYTARNFEGILIMNIF
jgi:hypothetical protein